MRLSFSSICLSVYTFYESLLMHHLEMTSVEVTLRITAYLYKLCLLSFHHSLKCINAVSRFCFYTGIWSMWIYACILEILYVCYAFCSFRGLEALYFQVVRPCVCLSLHLSVCLSVQISLNPECVKGINLK